MIHARQTTASAPRRCGTRSSVTTSAWAHPTFSTLRFGSRRAIPTTDSTLSSIESERRTLVPRFPDAPTTATLMLRALPRPVPAETPPHDVPSPATYTERGRGMRVLVTGARGKVGRATVAALQEAGHDVRATDLTPPVFERPEEGVADYVQADLADSGDAFAVVRGADAVGHTAAIPDPTSNPPHVGFQTNLMATFNSLGEAIRFGVARFVTTSSETVPGFFFPERPFLPSYVPVDEEPPNRPQGP